MDATPKIPYGYKLVTGQLRKGDGVWDETRQRFVKAKKDYPFVGLMRVVAIRKCEVVQEEFLAAEGAET